jgi:hypothetical protein
MSLLCQQLDRLAVVNSCTADCMMLSATRPRSTQVLMLRAADASNNTFEGRSLQEGQHNMLSVGQR